MDKYLKNGNQLIYSEIKIIDPLMCTIAKRMSEYITESPSVLNKFAVFIKTSLGIKYLHKTGLGS